MAKIGYARVSTKDQNLDLQINALKDAGCENIYKEMVSGRSRNRPQLKRLFNSLRSGDILIVWKIDRIARSARDVCEIADFLKEKNVILISIKDGINTSTILGGVFCKLAGVLAEVEICNLRERTIEGLKAARMRGARLGRPPGPSNPEKVQQIKTLLEQGYSDKEIFKKVKISVATFYRYKKLI